MNEIFVIINVKNINKIVIIELVMNIFEILFRFLLIIKVNDMNVRIEIKMRYFNAFLSNFTSFICFFAVAPTNSSDSVVLSLK